MKKRLTALMLALTMVLGTAALAVGTEKTISVSPMTLTVNGQAVTPQKSDGTAAEVFAYDGATYVPLRYLSELLGIQVDWTAESAGVAKLEGEGLKLPAASGDGTYTGKGSGFGGEVTAAVTVSGGKITACTLTGDKETPAIGGAALSKLQEQVLSAGSDQIDGVAGATMTSNAVKAAVADALAQASGSGDAAVKMAPGTYTATAYGFIQIEPLSVSVTVDESRILDIQVEGNRDSVAMVRSVKEYMVPRMLQYQSVAVDSISGATATSGAVKTATADALTQALKAGGSDASALAQFQTREEKKGGSETIDVDVLVVGMGGSGCAAAMSAVEAQAAKDPKNISVLAIDKAGRYGGTSAFCGEPLAVNAPKYKAQFNGGEDYMDGEALLKAWNGYTEGDAKMDVVEKFLKNSGDTVDWLFYDHGFQLNNPLTGFGPEDVYRCKYQYVSLFNTEEGRDYGEVIDGGQNTQADKYFKRLVDDYTELGGKYMLETEATELLYDKTGNKVTGVLAVGHDGTQYTINAKAVILAAGGFAGNGEMEEKYFSQNPYYKDLGGEWTMIGMAQNDGKMMASAIANGAGTYNIDMVPMVHFGTSNVVIHDYPYHVEENAAIDQWYGWERGWSLNNVPDAMVLTNMIPWVNTHGERFVKEGAMFSWWLSGPSYWAVWSEDLLDHVAKEGFPASVFTYAATSQGSTPGQTPIPEIREIADKLVDMGVMVKADSLEELAELMGVSADTFTKTMKDYGTYCEKGSDDQYGKDPSRLMALGEGPYYAMKGYSSTFSTVGGLDVDEDCNVLLADGKTPMGGLYAVGNDSGGVLYSNKKPYVTYGGAALGWAFTSGRLSGIAAVDYAAKGK